MKTQLFYSSYLTTYLEKDLKELVSVNDEVKFINFMKILASNTGEELVYDNYSKQVGASTNTIKAWISVLVKTGIVYLVEPYNEESIVKRVVKRPKMYFFDTGFAAYLCGIDSAETLQKSFLKGRFFEIKAGQMFNASNTKGFRKLQNTRYEKGKNAIICTADKISIISDGTLILPISSI